jgi:hypothetical protein
MMGRRLGELLNLSSRDLQYKTHSVLHPGTHADECKTDLMKRLPLLLVKHSKNYFIPFLKTLFKIH